jgi:excisionase family DNA binding protein
MKKNAQKVAEPQPPKLTFEDVPQTLAEVLQRIKAIEAKLEEPDDFLYDLEGICKYLGYSKSAIYKLTHLKQIPYVKTKQKLHFEKKTIDAWLAERKVEEQNK